MSIPETQTMPDEIWYRNVSILYNPERLIEFFPNRCSSLSENLNSLARMGIYGSLLISMYKRNPNHLGWIVVVLLFTYIVYQEQEKFTAKEPKSRAPQPARRPTVNNPFMNPTYLDAGKNREPVEEYHQDTRRAQRIREDVKEKFNQNLYHDIEDVFGRNNAQRQFHTVPSTTIPSDQERFRDFLFGDMKSCKDNSDHCRPYEDLRRNPPIMPT